MTGIAPRRLHRWCASAALIFAAVFVARVSGFQSAADRRVAQYATATPVDIIARLQRRIDAGEITLEFDPKRGYLPSVLKSLKIPESSQTLVYSKTSFQFDKIAPRTPRAVYFGDDIYIGWVQRGTVLEVASVDPSLGAVFYTLDQRETASPTFVRQTHNCLQCHDSTSNTGGVPGFVVQSVYTDRLGYPLPSPHNPVMSDRTPFRERFGGWYVTGTHGDQVHMGNVWAADAAGDIGNAKVYIDRLDLHATGNVTDLSARLNTAAYLSPGSDIVALMLLIHQASTHNAMAQASLDAGGPSEESSAEAVVRALLFIGAAPLAAPIQGSSQFAADFTRAGPRDRQGRSLRDLDLTHRLLKYPLSYLIYSEGFDGMPARVKAIVSRRLTEILLGKEDRREFATLTTADRQAILEILQDTKPGLLTVPAR
jgi:hypothetical protein